MRISFNVRCHEWPQFDIPDSGSCIDNTDLDCGRGRREGQVWFWGRHFDFGLFFIIGDMFNGFKLQILKFGYLSNGIMETI